MNDIKLHDSSPARQVINIGTKVLEQRQIRYKEIKNNNI